MKNLKWLVMFALLATMLTAGADDALAQRRGGGAPAPVPVGFKPYVELSATYGSMWGGNMDLSYYNSFVTLRTGTGPSYGFALTYNVHPMQGIEINYTRQEGSLDLDYKGINTLTDMSVNVWHIGSVRYLAAGKTKPFVFGSLGATYFSPEASSITLPGDESEDTEAYIESSTKFSLALGLGIKSYFGSAEKVGLRASFKVIPTFYDTWGGIYLGGGGAGVSMSGNAIWQWEAAIGLTVKLGA